MEEEINDLPERLRQIVEQLIKEADLNKHLPSQVQHLMVSIMTAMYKKGFDDSTRMVKAVLEKQEKLLK